MPDQSALLVDGANGVCDGPRHAHEVPWTSTLAATLAGVLVAGAILAVGRRRPLAALGLTTVLLAVAALPGLYALAAERPSRSTLASSVMGLHDRARAHAESVGPVEPGDCVACAPIVRLATIDVPDAAGASWTLSAPDLVGALPVVRPWVSPLRSALALGLAALLGAVGFALAGARAESGIALGLVARALAALAVVLSALFHPLAGLAALVIVGASVLGARHARPLPSRTSLLPLAALAALIVVALARPEAPMYWDELVWLAKARLAAASPLSFASIALDPATPLVPRGYPIFAPLSTALLALLDSSTAALLQGQIAISLLAMAAFVLVLARLDAVESGPRRLGLTLLVLGATPLFWAHWQSAYLDLAVGLFSATILLALRLDAQGDGIGRPLAAAVAIVLVGVKDEGAAHALAAVAAHLLSLRGPRAASVLALLGGALSLGSMRLALAVHGATNPDHVPDGLALGFVAPLLHLVAAHAADLTSWGAAPWLAATAAFVALRSRDPGVRACGLALLGSATCLLGAVLLGPDRVREFAAGGTLLGRMGIQLLPLGALTIASVLGPGAPRRDASPSIDRRDHALQRELDAALVGPPSKESAEGLQTGTT